jgi:hypothetical protein
MSSLIWIWISSSTMVGGGVCGRTDGIARGTIIQAGITIEAPRLFIVRSLQTGGLIIGSIVGEGINGTTSEYLIETFNRTGEDGKRAGIGSINKPGVSRICNPKRDHGNQFVRSNHNSSGHRLKRSNQVSHNNTGRQVHKSAR